MVAITKYSLKSEAFWSVADLLLYIHVHIINNAPLCIRCNGSRALKRTRMCFQEGNIKQL